MDKTFEKYLRSGISLEVLEAGRQEYNIPYFCTPEGATIFGWAGVDGIHFCFIRRFGGMVFAVSPTNSAPDYVHPVAENFADFLRLLLACAGTAAVEQAWMWDRTQFEAFLLENPATPKQQEMMNLIRERFHLEPMEQPWDYIKKLQSSFDYRKIEFSENYYDTIREIESTPPEWKVYFNGSFWSHEGRDRAGKEFRLDKHLDWAGYHWEIPSAYICSKGMVVDFCMQVDPEMIRSFREKWGLDEDDDTLIQLSREQRMELDLDNPFCLNFEPNLQLNGKEMHPTHGCSVCYAPCVSEGYCNELEAKWVVEHYGLDTSCGWMICRNAFPWVSNRRPEIKTLSLTMIQQPQQVPGPHFKPAKPGDTLSFVHPESGIDHTITVRSLEQQQLPPNSFGCSNMEYPSCYSSMEYTIHPEPADRISIFDCTEGDHPREIMLDKDPMKPTDVESCAIAIIGGADGPTVLALGVPEPSETLHTACSSLHFEPIAEDVEWRIVFNLVKFEERTFLLL